MSNKLVFYLKQNYQVKITVNNDGSYFAEIPELKGCMTVGRSLEEVKQSIQDAKVSWLETAIECNIENLLPEAKA